MASDLFHQSHHFLIGKADFFKLEAVILFSSFLQQQSGVFIGVWVLPTRTFVAVYGQRLCLLFSQISYPQNMMLPLFPKPGAFYFHFFQADPCFSRRKYPL